MTNMPLSREFEWQSYYDYFPYFSRDLVREGCHPRIMEHETSPKGAVVLVHGLTDSPGLLTSIADYFFSTLEYNVYLPLLHCHGLVNPAGMEEVSLDEWKKNVEFAIEQAATQVEKVSVGGLSTGGTLSLYEAITHPKINGTVYLFSAALDLLVQGNDLLGDIAEKFLLSPLQNCFDTQKPIVGERPFGYTRLDTDGARELAKLILELNGYLKRYNPNNPLPFKLFAAHSGDDVTADMKEVKDLEAIALPGQYSFFLIPKDKQVAHASVVLQKPIYAIGAGPTDPPLRQPNPMFSEMMQAIATF